MCDDQKRGLILFLMASAIAGRAGSYIVIRRSSLGHHNDVNDEEVRSATGTSLLAPLLSRCWKTL